MCHPSGGWGWRARKGNKEEKREGKEVEVDMGG